MIVVRLKGSRAVESVECADVGEAVALLRRLAEEPGAEPARPAEAAEPNSIPRTPSEAPQWRDAAPHHAHVAAFDVKAPPSREVAPEPPAHGRGGRRDAYDVLAFVAAWNAAESIADVANQFGCTRNAASMRAQKCRAAGHTLKSFRESARRDDTPSKQPEPSSPDRAVFDPSTMTATLADGTTKPFRSVAAGQAFVDAENERLAPDIDDPEDDD